MPQDGLPLLTNWQNFYMMMGTASATLTGLMFLVITLIAGVERHVSVLNAAIEAFNTPTIVHFCEVLFMAGILSAPWQGFSSIGLLLGLSGAGGAVYLTVVMQRMRSVPGYQTPVRDWFWYVTVPIITYIVLMIASVMLQTNPAAALYIISAVMIILLFLGIRNAWDLVTFLAVERSHPENKDQE